MTPALRAVYEHELNAAQAARQVGDFDKAFQHLERAHIISQRYTWLHMRSHIAMLRIGWLRRDAREVFEQMLRIVAASVFSRIWVPEGNTGGANVSAMRPMPIAEDLAKLLADARRQT